MHITLTSTIYRCCILLFLALAYTTAAAQAQRCTLAGQTPATPFDVCGTQTFNQSAAAVCSNGRLQVPGCRTSGDNNPHWYRFTCYTTGTLGFVITPADPNGEDYDWQLFDITGHNPAEVFTNTSLFVSGNWCGGYFPTGTNTTATRNIACGSGPGDTATFNKMPLLKQQHIYLLMVSRANDQSTYGYKLAFGGGTALITDTTQAPPKFIAATPNCAANKIVIAVNKKMQCSSLATNGSDFILSPQAATVTAARAIRCGNTGMDSIELTLSQSISVGNYTITVKQGTDGNTLFDNCGNEMQAGSKTALTIEAAKPVDMDSLVPPGCKPQTLTLVFKKNIYCNTIAANGSDFTISGPQAVTITAASANCSNGLGNIITLTLSSPITQPGLYTITLQNGSDGNTLADECNNILTAGQQLSFNAAGSVSAAFTLQVKQSCSSADTVVAGINNTANTNSVYWLFDDGNTYNTPTITRLYGGAANGNLTCVASNNMCSDTATKSFVVPSKLQASFTIPVTLCPKESAVFTSTSTGVVSAYKWYFGNGDSSSLAQPTIIYPTIANDTTYKAALIIQNDTPCYDTAYGQLTVLADCSIRVPTAFTPNGDGRNDYLYPIHAYNVSNLLFRVFNRWGQLVFESRNASTQWDGTFKGIQQPMGAYAWQLSYTVANTGKRYVQQGTSVLIR